MKIFASLAKEKGEQIKADGTFWNTYNLDCATYFYIGGQMSIKIFIRQTLEEVALDQLDEGMWI